MINHMISLDQNKLSLPILCSGLKILLNYFVTIKTKLISKFFLDDIRKQFLFV